MERGDVEVTETVEPVKEFVMHSNITLNGTIAIDGIPVVAMYGEVSLVNGGSSTNMNVQNSELYNDNRTWCRSKEREFKDRMYELEDALHEIEGR